MATGIPMLPNPWNPSLAVSAVGQSGRVKKVSWAPEPQLLQVRLFAAGDAPHAAAQRSRSDQLAVAVEEAARTAAANPKRQRPGRAGHFSRQAIEALRPSTAWQPPPKMTLNPEWQVPAGDESGERSVQDARVRGTLEAIYLHGSAIPNSPGEPEVPTPPPLADSAIPLVPLMPVDDDAVLDEEDIPAAHSGVQAPPPPQGPPPSHLPMSVSPASIPAPPSHPPPPSAASAPLPATISTFGASASVTPPGLDNRALLDLLNNPALLQLVGKTQPGAAPNTGQALEQLASILGGLGPRPPVAPPPPPGIPPSHRPHVPPPHPPPGSAPLPPGRPPLPGVLVPPPSAGVRPPFAPHAGPRPPPGPPPGWPQQNRPRFEPPGAPSPPGFPPHILSHAQRPVHHQGEWRPPKDAQRGPPPRFPGGLPMPNGVTWEGHGKKGGGRGPRPVGRPDNMRDKKMCLYFNTPQGCHKGENCAFYHARQAGFVDSVANGSSPQQIVPPAKRTKLDGYATSFRTQA